MANEMGGNGGGGEPRIGLWSGSRATWEMEQLHEQFDIFGLKHCWSAKFQDEVGSWSGGWLKEALDFLGRDL